MFLYVFEVFFIILGHLGSFLSNLKFFDFSLYGPLLNPRGAQLTGARGHEIRSKIDFFPNGPKTIQNHPKWFKNMFFHVFKCFFMFLSHLGSFLTHLRCFAFSIQELLEERKMLQNRKISNCPKTIQNRPKWFENMFFHVIECFLQSMHKFCVTVYPLGVTLYVAWLMWKFSNLGDFGWFLVHFWPFFAHFQRKSSCCGERQVVQNQKKNFKNVLKCVFEPFGVILDGFGALRSPV